VDIVYMVVGAAVGFGGAFWPGYRYGERCRRLRRFRYWVANAVGMLVGILLAIAASMLQLSWLWLAAVGVMAGSITGLKWGLGRTVGLVRPANVRTAGDGAPRD
jgi:hypothetical protein